MTKIFEEENLNTESFKIQWIAVIASSLKP